MKPFIPALMGPRGGLVVAPAEKASLLGSQFDRKQCREQFGTPLSCFPQSRSNSLAFRTFVLMRLLLNLDTYEVVDPLGVFPLFLNKVVDIIAPQNKAKFFVSSSIWDRFWSVVGPHPLIGKTSDPYQ